jgi:hypothetical protein
MRRCANGGRRYWAAAQERAAQALRPKTPKLACPQLAAQAARWLAEWCRSRSAPVGWIESQTIP